METLLGIFIIIICIMLFFSILQFLLPFILLFVLAFYIHRKYTEYKIRKEMEKNENTTYTYTSTTYQTGKDHDDIIDVEYSESDIDE